jgi:hypothetical protein
MNFSFNGPIWRASLKAVPENRRSEVLGTLTECYGDKAPLGEAFRTFTSGSRMHNRANASSPTDLWREAARNAVVFITVFSQMEMLGREILPQRSDYDSPFWPGLVLAVATGIIAVLFLRGRCAKTFIGVIFGTQVVSFCVGAYQQHKESIHGVSWIIWTVQVIFVLSCFGLFVFRRSFRNVCLVVIATASALAASEWLVPSFDHAEIFRSRNSYALWASAGAFGATCLLALAVLASGVAASSKPEPRWWPFLLGFGLALGLSFNQSTWVPERWTSPLNRSLGALVIGLLILSVAVALARPQLGLTFCLVYVTAILRFAFLGSFSNSSFISHLPLVPMLIAAATMFLGWQAAKRSLRT